MANLSHEMPNMAYKWLNFLGASHMINSNIFNIYFISTFSFGYFLDLVFRAIFTKFCQNTGLVKYPKEKVEKQKMLINVIIYHM